MRVVLKYGQIWLVPIACCTFLCQPCAVLSHTRKRAPDVTWLDVLVLSLAYAVFLQRRACATLKRTKILGAFTSQAGVSSVLLVWSLGALNLPHVV